MKTSTSVLMGALVVLFAAGTGLCAPTFNSTTGHWYDIVSSGSNGSWDNAESNAIALGGHLVTIDNAAEESWLRSTFGNRRRYWIGFTDAATEGSWEWSSGNAVTYTNWDAGEPSNHMPPETLGEDYAVLNWNRSTGGWNDWSHQRPDYYRIRGIAEYDAAAPVPVPVPSSLLLATSGFALVRRYFRTGSRRKKA